MGSHHGDFDCTCYRLRQTARLLSRTYDQFLAPSGMSIGQFGVLATLSDLEGASVSSLANVLQMERTTLTRNLLPLQKAGYVATGEGPDKRFRTLSLTKAGKKALTAATPMWRAAQQSLEEHLGMTKVQSLNRMLDGTL